MVEQLRRLCPQASTDQLYKEVLNAKTDVGSLSAEEMLRRDAKLFEFGAVRVGVSSVPLALADWVRAKGEEALACAFESHAAAGDMHLLLVMSAFSTASGGLARQLLVYLPQRHASQHARTFATLNRFLEKSNELQLEPLKIGAPHLEANTAALAIYNQKNAAASRKQLQPLLSSFFASHKL